MLASVEPLNADSGMQRKIITANKTIKVTEIMTALRSNVSTKMVSVVTFYFMQLERTLSLGKLSRVPAIPSEKHLNRSRLDNR